MSFFEHVVASSPDPVFGTGRLYQEDIRKFKVNLVVGVFRTEGQQTPILRSVKRAEEFLLLQETEKNYLPIDGSVDYLEQTGLLIFGRQLWEAEKGRIYGAQTLGGTGALRVGADFLHDEISTLISIPNPTWPNHRQIFQRVGMKIDVYPYYDYEKRDIGIDGLLEHLDKLPPKTIVLLHACCHNPTGADPTFAQWQEIAHIIKKRFLIPFFDCAYLGFGKGLDADAEAIRLFVEKGHEMVISVSYSKNFGLYGERVGALFIVSQNGGPNSTVGTKIRALIRSNYSNPPIHGAYVAEHILKTSELRTLWEQELEKMRERIMSMRMALSQVLEEKSQKNYRFLQKGNGLFSFFGFTQSQTDWLIAEYGIYMGKEGRVNIAGLNKDNIHYVANAINNL